MSRMSSDEVRRAWLAERLVPLWESPSAHKPAAPPLQPYIWKWEKIRPLVDLAFAETSPAAIERRVLQYVCPHAVKIFFQTISKFWLRDRFESNALKPNRDQKWP